MNPSDTPPAAAPSVRDLRRRWKPTKERLLQEKCGERIRIRIHRALSWLARLEELAEGAPLDTVLIYRWIALNSLYGNWDADARQPVSDRASLSTFLDRVLALDRDGRLHDVLLQRKRSTRHVFRRGCRVAMLRG